MNEELKDKGLKRVMKEQPQFRLSSNFTFRTMQKVEEVILLQEKKVERRTLYAIIATSVFLIVSSIGGLMYFFGDKIINLFQIRIDSVHIQQIPPVYILFIIVIPIFMWFDQWIRKQYFKRHST